MTRAIDTSLTLVDPQRDKTIGIDLFADRERYIAIRDLKIGEALGTVAGSESPRRRFRVGRASSGEEAEFFVLDVKRDKELLRGLTRVIDDGFLDAVNHTIKVSIGHSDGLLSADATAPLDAVEEVIEFLRFISNAAARSRSRPKRELLFHHSPTSVGD